MALKKLFIKDCRLTSASGDTVDQRRNYLVKTSDYTLASASGDAIHVIRH